MPHDARAQQLPLLHDRGVTISADRQPSNGAATGMLVSVRTADNDIDTLASACTTLVDDVRAQVAAGHTPDAEAELRLRALCAAARSRDPAQAAEIDELEERALARLERVLSVHRARTLLTRTPERPATPPRRAALRTRATITGNMEVRRETVGDTFVLGWDATAPVTSWEVRISERDDVRSDYLVRETLSLPPEATSVELPLTESTLRVHVLGRGRGGRLLRRAVISALTSENWNERWQRRASAS